MNSVARWITYGFLGALTLAIIVFPSPPALEPIDRAHYLSQDLQRAQLRWMAQSEILRRVDSREVARQAVIASPPSSARGEFEFVQLAGVSSDVMNGIKRVATRTLRMPRRDSTIRVVIAVTLDTGEKLDGVIAHRSGWRLSTDTFFPGGISPNSCVIVARTTRNTRFDTHRTDFGGQPCYWYGTYGIPGRGVATMLDSTQNRALIFHEGRVSGSVESYLEYSISNDMRALKCRSGERAMCQLMLLAPRFRADIVTPQWSGAGRYYGPSYGDYLPGVLLSRVEREVGSANFARIWKSDKPFADAFTEVRGVPLGDWIHDYVVSRLDTRDSGPLPRPRVWIALAIAIPALIAIGAYGASRRAGLG